MSYAIMLCNRLEQDNSCQNYLQFCRKVTVVIPCFPYARQPDTPYKKNGAPLSRFSEPEKAKYKHLVRTASATASPEKPLRAQNPVVELGSPFKNSLSSLAISPSRVVETGTSTTNPFIVDGGGATTTMVSDEFKPNGLVDVSSSPLAKSHAEAGFRRRTSSTVSLDPSARISTISTSQPQIEVKALQPQTPAVKPIPVGATGGSTGGYKHWTARSGTLIANMLVAAGIYAFPSRISHF